MTIKQRWLNEWRRREGVWTRPAAKAFYDTICDGNSDFTSMTIQPYLRQFGTILGSARPGGHGHYVQVWVMDDRRFWSNNER